MYICICSGITTEKVKEFSDKYPSFREMVKEQRVCTNCSCCKKEMKATFESFKDKN